MDEIGDIQSLTNLEIKVTKNLITRFAPSPSGLLHVGNVRTALLNYLVSKKSEGEFILRIDDTDKERSKEEFVKQIEEDLIWLGLNFNQLYRQSERIRLYDKAFNKLIDKGLIYPCFETPEDLDKKRKRLIARRRPPVYDRASLKLSSEEIDEKIKSGIKPYWRFKLSNKKIKFKDLIRGEITVDTAAQSDPVIKRVDGDYLYNLPSVVDDIDMKISHIIRGEDHITNSAIQIEIFNALDSQSPIFGHNSLLVRENGKPFSKRNAASSIVQLKEESFDPNAINSLNVSIGSSIDIEAFTSLKEMSEKFNIQSLGKAPARYSLDQLSKLNSQIISDYSFSKISELLDNKFSNFSEEFWDCIKQNISNLSEIDEWYNIINANIEAKIDDVEYLNLSEELLPKEPWDESTWDNWIALLKDKTSKSGKELFLPIRIALTGKSNGPELNKLILLLGYNEVKRRLLRN